MFFFFPLNCFTLLVVSYNSLDTHKDIYTKCKAKHLFALHQIYLQLFCISERDEGRVKRYEAWRGFKVGAGIGDTRRGTRYGGRGTRAATQESFDKGTIGGTNFIRAVQKKALRMGAPLVALKPAGFTSSNGCRSGCGTCRRGRRCPPASACP